MKWAIMFVVFIAGVFYLLIKHAPTEADRSHKKWETMAGEEDKEKIDQPTPIEERLDGLTVKTIEKLRHDTNADVRLAALDLLYHLNHPMALDYMMEAVTKDTDSKMRVGLLKRLQDEKDVAAIPVFATALRNLEPEVKLAAIKALEKVVDPESIVVLRSALEDTDPKIKVRAMKAIEVIEKEREKIRKEEETRLRKLKKRWL